MIRSNPTTIQAKNNNSVPFQQFHGNKKLRSIKTHQKALVLFMILSSSPFINTIQLQLSCQGRCSRPAPGCPAHPLQKVVNFHCPVPVYFLSCLISKSHSTHAPCFSCRQSLGRCECKYQMWVTLKSRRRQSNNIRRRQHVRFKHHDLWCKSNLRRKGMWNDGC